MQEQLPLEKPAAEKPPYFELYDWMDCIVYSVLVVVLLLAAYVLVKIVFTEAGRVPVDDPRTHLELTMIHEAMCLDYGCIDLAFIQIAGWLKGAALAVLAAVMTLTGNLE